MKSQQQKTGNAKVFPAAFVWADSYPPSSDPNTP